MKLAVAIVLACGVAHAQPVTTLHAGLDVRTDLGAHPVRVPLGFRRCAWDTTLVIDPMAAFDGEHDLDAIGEWFAGERIALLVGWRWSMVGVAGGYHHQQRSLVGVTATGPDFWSSQIRTRASLELATMWVKHGGGVDADWISADRNLIDHFAFGLSVRLEYAR